MSNVQINKTFVFVESSFRCLSDLGKSFVKNVKGEIFGGDDYVTEFVNKTFKVEIRTVCRILGLFCCGNYVILAVKNGGAFIIDCTRVV